MIHCGLLMLAYAAAAAQAVLAPGMAFGDARPEFLLLAVLAAGLLVRDWPALAWAAAIGLIDDCLSDRPLGLGMLVATLVLLFVQRRRSERAAGTFAGTCGIAGLALFTMVLARDTIARTVTRDGVAPAALIWESASAAGYSLSLGVAAGLLWKLLRSRSARLGSARLGSARFGSAQM